MPAVTIRYLLTLATVAAGASFQFYNLQVVNGVQAIVQEWINCTYVSRNGVGMTSSTLTLFWSLCGSSAVIGAFVGSLLTRPIAEHLGRRNGLIANAVLNVGGSLAAGLSKTARSPELLVAARLVLGVNIGLCSGLAPMYLTEITPKRFRGAAGTAHMIAIAFGDALSLAVGLPEILGTETLWPVAFGLPGIPALLLLILLPFSYESPRYLLLSLGKREEATAAISAFFGRDNADEVLKDLMKEAALQSKRKSKTSTIGTLFRKPSLRLPLFISLLVMLAQQFTGCASIFIYSTDIFTQAGLDLHAARLATMGIGVGYFLCVLPSPFLIERFGRRPLELFQLSGCMLALSCLSLMIWLREAHQLAWASSVSIASLGVFMCVYGSGSPVAWLVSSELFSQEHRSAAVSISTFTAFLLGSIVSLAYLPFQRAVGPELSFLPFIIVLFFSLIAMYMLLPETKNRSIEDIVSEFRKRVHSVSHKTSGSSDEYHTSEETDKLIENGQMNGYGTQEYSPKHQLDQ